MGQVAVMGAEARGGAASKTIRAGGGRSLKRKSRLSGKFWFSDPKVQPDPMFGPYRLSSSRRHSTKMRSESSSGMENSLPRDSGMSLRK